MMNKLQKFAVAMIAAVGASTADAGPRHDHYDHNHYHPKNQRHHHYQPTVREICQKAIHRQRPTYAFRYANVGFIEGRGFACQVNLNDLTLRKSFDFGTRNGLTNYRNAVYNAAHRDDQIHDKIHRPHRGYHR